MLIITIDYLLSITFYNVTVFLIQIIECTSSLVVCFYTFLRNSLQFFYYFFLTAIYKFNYLLCTYTHIYTFPSKLLLSYLFISIYEGTYIFFIFIYLFCALISKSVTTFVSVCVWGTCSSYDITLYHKTRKTVYDDGATIKLITSAAKKFYLMD